MVSCPGSMPLFVSSGDGGVGVATGLKLSSSISASVLLILLLNIDKTHSLPLKIGDLGPGALTREECGFAI